MFQVNVGRSRLISIELAIEESNLPWPLVTRDRVLDCARTSRSSVLVSANFVDLLSLDLRFASGVRLSLDELRRVSVCAFALVPRSVSAFLPLAPLFLASVAVSLGFCTGRLLELTLFEFDLPLVLEDRPFASAVAPSDETRLREAFPGFAASRSARFFADLPRGLDRLLDCLLFFALDRAISLLSGLSLTGLATCLGETLTDEVVAAARGLEIEFASSRPSVSGMSTLTLSEPDSGRSFVFSKLTSSRSLKLFAVSILLRAG